MKARARGEERIVDYHIGGAAGRQLKTDALSKSAE